MGLEREKARGGHETFFRFLFCVARRWLRFSQRPRHTRLAVPSLSFKPVDLNWDWACRSLFAHPSIWRRELCRCKASSQNNLVGEQVCRMEAVQERLNVEALASASDTKWHHLQAGDGRPALQLNLVPYVIGTFFQTKWKKKKHFCGRPHIYVCIYISLYIYIYISMV